MKMKVQKGKSFVHRNPLPHPFVKWERVRSSAGEGVEYNNESYPIIRTES